MLRGVCLICLAAVLILAFQNVNADHNIDYYQPQRYNRVRRPVIFISSGSNVRAMYVPPTAEDPAAEDPAAEYPTAEDSSAEDLAAVALEDAPKVRLDIYYETDCPDSMRFITNQLYPLYQEMDEVVDINLVPYGKAHEDYDEVRNRYNFRCHHGPSECYGNTVQGCVMSLYPEKKDYMTFIKCMESYPRPSMNGHKCARRLSLDWEKIDKCAKGDEGNRILHEMAQQTENIDPPLYFVPWIVVDKVFSEANQRTALYNLKRVVCDTYKGNHASCQ